MALNGQRAGRVILGRAWFIEELNNGRRAGDIALREEGGVDYPMVHVIYVDSL